MSTEPDASRLPQDWEKALFGDPVKRDEFYAGVDVLYAEGRKARSRPGDPTSSARSTSRLSPASRSSSLVRTLTPPAFSYRGEGRIPRSLQTIFHNLASDEEIQLDDRLMVT